MKFPDFSLTLFSRIFSLTVATLIMFSSKCFQMLQWHQTLKVKIWGKLMGTYKAYKIIDPDEMPHYLLLRR